MNYHFEEWGNFTGSQFEEKILEAKRFLAKEFDVEESTIQQARHSQDIGMSIGTATTFPVSVLWYEVIKEEKVVAYLEGLLSNEGNYMSISSTKL